MGFKRPTKKTDVKDSNVKPIPFKRLFRYITSLQVVMLLIGGLAACTVGAALPITSIFFGKMVDAFTDYQLRRIDSDQFQSVVNDNALYFVYLALGVFLCTYTYMSCYIYVGGRLTFQIRKSYLKAILRQQLSYFDSLGSGEVATRITTDTNLVQDGVSEKIALLIQDITTFISGFVIAFTADWKLTLVVLCIIPALVITIGFLTFFATKFVTQTLTYYSDAGSLVEETISSIKTVLAFNQQAKLIKIYEENLEKAEKSGSKKAFAIGVGVGSIFFFIYCGYSLAFYFGGSLILDNLTQSGKVVNVFFAILIGAFSLSNVAPNIQALSVAKGAGAKLFEAIDSIPTIDVYSDKGLKLEKVVGRLELKGIKFAYPSRPDVQIFDDFALTVTEGTTVALVGASGSGKSTVIQLLERFYDPIQGTVLLDGVDIKTININWLRQQIGLVSQEPTLFSGSVAFNVALGLIGTQHENLSLQEQMPLIEEACKLANAHEFIIELQDQYHTQVGERGFLLSGGQKQRIAIARAIVKDPKILLLDEATSALDSRSEAVVQDALDKAAKNRTTVTIAHRLSTIKDADTIVVMEQGKVVEMGSHKQLIELDNVYNRLIKLQEVNYLHNSEQLETPSEGTVVYKSNTVQSLDPETNSLELVESNKVFNRSGFQLAVKVFKINKSEMHLYLLGTLGAVALGLVYPIFSILFSEILTVFLKTGDALRQGTNFWSLMFLIIAMAAGIATFAQIGFFGLAAEKLTTRLRIKAFRSILDQEPAWFDNSQNTTGALTSKLSTDAQDIQGLSGVTLGTLAQTSTNLIGSITVGLIYGWKLALVIAATLPLLIGAGYLQLTMTTMFQESNKKAYADSAELACEAVGSIRTVASLTRELQVVNNYTNSMHSPLKASTHNAFVASLAFAAAQSTNFLVNGLGFWYGATLFKQGEYDYTQFFAVFMALVVGAGGIGRSFAYGPDIAKAKSAAISLFSLLERQPLISSSQDTTKKMPKELKGKVEFSDVQFRYPTRFQHRVLKGIDFTVQPGSFVALVGPSGCGKSTTVSLIERFYDVTRGTLKIDDTDVRDFSLPHLRDSMALVSQEPSLYNLTIEENIAFGAKLDNPNPSQQQIEQAAKLANIHEFILSLPDGYKTKVGSKGSQLSGGQKQRIAIARALLRNPKILLLDEATSALDAESEKEVQQALDKAKLGRTTIAIAHRLSTIQNADLILVFHKGRIVERGTHQYLLDLKGFYFRMVGEQVLTL